MTTIAFIGLGNMGGPMAANLIKAGFSVRVFDLVEANVTQLEQQGAYAAKSAEEAAQGANALITMLPAGKHVAGLLSGPDGLLAKLPKNTLVIDSSTIDAETSRAVHAEAKKYDLLFIDAPVSGGVAAATAGTLSFMCGGSADAFEAAKAPLSAMGANLFHAGPEGAGQVAKMCNNMLLAIHMIGTSEALKLGEKNGVDASVLSEIMMASSGKNWSLEKYNPYPGVMPASPASNDYKPGFMVDLMTKDLGLAMDNAQNQNSATPLGALAYELYKQKQANGEGARDFSSIIELID
ncbi:3-hydroxyisobutyrate dehydrogenase, partial [Oleiphilus sp. HI0133]